MLTIYHNPKCSKSRQTLQLIEQANIDVTIVEYLKKPLTIEEIKKLISLLKVSAIDITRTKEAEFKAQNLVDASEAQLITALVNTPKLLERPIVVSDNKACIGRPPENVLALF
jgi:arsenate reductase (glutaredoxin)